MATGFIGEIRMFGGNFAPRGWALCNGQLIAISQNYALFAILGTTYGGDGMSTFGLPDLRGRAPVHWGQSPGLSNYVLGEKLGSENITLLSSQMPAHTHNVNANTGGGTAASPAAGFLAVESTGTSLNYASSSNTTMNPAMIAPAGNGLPVSIIQPVLSVSFIICLTGVFPSRN